MAMTTTQAPEVNLVTQENGRGHGGHHARPSR